ncbi:class I SAM-dependent methyltransferase [Methanobacterium lacus]|nr:class I SAM-dependent methyltransferase [Methanobacterium lacus]
MLNKKASTKDSNPDEIVENLGINKGDIIGDIGAGGGYFTLEFSKKVGGNGKVYAIDTNQKSLDYISKNNTLNNIETKLVEDDEFVLPEKVDIFFLRNVFHHLQDPVEYFKNLSVYLKNEGLIVVIDYKKKGFSFVGMFGHYTSEDDIIKQLEAAGFGVLKQYDFLQDQSFIKFKRRN